MKNQNYFIENVLITNIDGQLKTIFEHQIKVFNKEKINFINNYHVYICNTILKGEIKGCSKRRKHNTMETKTIMTKLKQQ